MAERKITHTGKDPQRCAFTIDDFELEEGAKFEAVVRVKAVGNEEIEAISEDFSSFFGESSEKTKSSSGTIVERALVEGAIGIENKEDFDNARVNHENLGRDSKGFITFRCQNGRTAPTSCPPLLQLIEEDWANRRGNIGHSVVQVRTEGSRADEIKFIPLLKGCAITACI